MTDEFIQPLLAWYDENKRILPWRDKHNAYYTWVSEIMLQQTRVEAVKPYFERFIRELPDIPALAVCPEEKLLSCGKVLDTIAVCGTCSWQPGKW